MTTILLKCFHLPYFSSSGLSHSFQFLHYYCWHLIFYSPDLNIYHHLSLISIVNIHLWGKWPYHCFLRKFLIFLSLLSIKRSNARILRWPRVSNTLLSSGWNKINTAVIPTPMVLVNNQRITSNFNTVARTHTSKSTIRPFTITQALVVLIHFMTL